MDSDSGSELTCIAEDYFHSYESDLEDSFDQASDLTTPHEESSAYLEAPSLSLIYLNRDISPETISFADVRVYQDIKRHISATSPDSITLLEEVCGPYPSWKIPDDEAVISTKIRRTWVINGTDPFIIVLTRSPNEDAPRYEVVNDPTRPLFEMIRSRSQSGEWEINPVDTESLSPERALSICYTQMINYDRFPTSPLILLDTSNRPAYKLQRLKLNQVPGPLQMAFTDCEHLVESCCQLRLFSRQTLHLVYALHHLVHAFAEELSKGPIMSPDHLNYRIELEECIAKMKTLVQQLQGDQPDPHGLQHGLINFFAILCREWYGVVPVRHSYSLFKQFAELDKSEEQMTTSKSSLDLVDRISGMFRLLSLETEQGSNGLVEKVLIAQNSVKKFANDIHPGSYRSEFQVDFHALDKHVIKPKGVYGSISAIVGFLEQLGRIDLETRRLLLMPQDEFSNASQPTLCPGLYAVKGPYSDPSLIYIVFWPEKDTWDDGKASSASRNRVTFMRYLTKLCDQVVCLISDEHASLLVLKENTGQLFETEDDHEFDDRYDRLFSFSVQETQEEKETAREEEGFTIYHNCIEQPIGIPSGFPMDFPFSILQSQLVVGETNQAILHALFVPESLKSAPMNDSLQMLALEDRLSVKSHGIVLGPGLDKDPLPTPTQAGIQYTLHQLDIRSEDLDAISANPNHVCKPTVRLRTPPSFFLSVHQRLRFMRLLENDRCLAIIEDHLSFQVYLEPVNKLATSVDTGKCAQRFVIEKIGERNLFAVDETKKLLIIVSTLQTAILLHVYQYDPESRAIGARGSAINITKWYQHLPVITFITFVAGSEELFLVEERGTCRVFSFVTETFKSSRLQVTGEVQAAASSSDGACLFLKVVKDNRARVFCHHWASFGGPGIEIPWPEGLSFHAQMEVSSVGTRTSTHLIFTDTLSNLCISLHILITRKSSEFAFRSTSSSQTLTERSRDTINNSLIDCHAEVWTRYPVLAPIHRETNDSATHYPRSITFISSASPTAFAPYFTSLLREFEQKTRKPTKGILGHIKVSATSQWSPSYGDALVSQLQAGDWFVGLFCLIPIHLAVTESNRFKPLKDGVISPEFEQNLQGATVAQISEALSFGWYESIFSSYLANKPVKVVTSMGEQSVGKSFALNHFVDTSFAGSAMHCTKGVWLSVTPTRDYLVVSMDFEGVHSIGKSKQEDTLLILLNCAISNLVLFRNNFALSRDIAGLFTSLQSCAKVLDPASNKSLFHSTLVIIIKDVNDSDTKEILNEFRQKLQLIIQQEREENFISKLHRGKLDIFPWPVIESSRFYDSFSGLKRKLDSQPIVHHHASAFLRVLKMLMAKLKANDWGALDQNLAIQRSQQLGSLLHFALALGTTDPTTGEPLRNYDTDEQFNNNDTSARFYLEGNRLPAKKLITLSECSKQLHMGWQEHTIRFTIEELEFIQRYGAYLNGLADARIKHVQAWLKVNTSHFGEQAEIKSLFRDFDSLSKELRRSVLLCGSKCSSCGLLCLEFHEHNGEHNCMTSHRCPEACGFIEQHEDEILPCDLFAAHTGRHVCSGTPHLCGLPCHLLGKSGCLEFCTKPVGHEEDEGHLCAASTHTCGELCSLVKKDGTRLCHRPCVVDCRRVHDVHTCDRPLSCPISCQLCNSFCAVGDHFHALDDDAIHLCGQNHMCPKLCELPGICEIETNPQSIKSIFVGRHESFQYTRYSQGARRRKCAISIAPGQLEHGGPHIHSTEPDLFHYCEQKCMHCGYFCTLPLNHSHNEHDTSHGSMSQTEWVVEGNDDAFLELQGRKYAAGDSGAPMLCSLLCKSLGRHVHVDRCRLDEDGKCVGGEEVEHIDGSNNLDWISHRLFWARSGFRDPYSQMEQQEFDLCDRRCSGEEHNPDVNEGAQPSYCTLPLFHAAPDPKHPPPLGHISHNGHSYDCKNPLLMQHSFHTADSLKNPRAALTRT